MKATHKIKKSNRSVMLIGYSSSKAGGEYAECIVPYTPNELRLTSKRPLESFHVQTIRMSSLTKIELGYGSDDDS